MSKVDITLIGGGIVGLATAWRLIERNGDLRIVVLEKEAKLATHQTGHNSGVLHSGIYYRPGSLRAVNCHEGKSAMEAFCEEHDIAYDICGKVIVAVNESEVERLQDIYQRGLANGVKCELIGKERLAELEPHTVGVQAVHVPEAGIVDYRQVCLKLGEVINTAGVDIRTNTRVTNIDKRAKSVVLETTTGPVESRFVINCAGLHSDRIAKLGGQRVESKVVPFRGEYYELLPEAQHLCRNLIYPVPDPSFPFLGVHFTRMIQGGVECGPNAVLAFAREGYRKTDINLRDLSEVADLPWFSTTCRQALANRCWRNVAVPQ